MKYRTKLYLALLIISLTSTALGLGIAYVQVRSFFLKELQSKVMSIAAAAAADIDSQSLKSINSIKDQNSTSYKKIQHELRAIRDASRRHDVYIKFIYTIQPKKVGEGFFFQVDAEEATADFSPYGEEVEDAKDDNLTVHLHQVYSPLHFIVNRWGTWMSGFAPIYDSKGIYVATIGVDLQASDVISKLNELLIYGVFAFMGAISMALFTAYFLAKRQTNSLRKLYEGVKKIGNGNLNERINLTTQDEFGHLAFAINNMAKGLSERNRLSTNLARYVSQHVIEDILKTETPINMQGEQRKITLFFSDIRDFTQIAEKLPPQEIVTLLNEYFACMVEIIFKNHGTLDKFLGDGMMIEFGAPLDDPMQELHAVQTAFEMLAALKKLNQKWQSEGRPKIEIGIGIHSGMAIVGNIGSEKRIEYTAIGDAVNVASRLEQLTKEFKTPIIISRAAMEPIADQFTFKNLGNVTLRGRSDQIQIYSPIKATRK